MMDTLDQLRARRDAARIASLERMVNILTWLELVSGMRQCRHCHQVCWPDELRHRTGCIAAEVQ